VEVDDGFLRSRSGEERYILRDDVNGAGGRWPVGGSGRLRGE
jgi:hypothetical protein